MLVAIKKYKFYRFIVKLEKLSIDLKKVRVIVNWWGLKLFLEFYNYY